MTTAITLSGHPAASPSTLPAWITPELIELTLRVWQPFYRVTLATHDAVQILLITSRLFGVIGRSERKMTHTGKHHHEQTIRRTRTSQQP